MNTFCGLVERDVEELFCESPAKKKFNLSKSEKDALDKLCRNKDIVVKCSNFAQNTTIP